MNILAEQILKTLCKEYRNFIILLVGYEPAGLTMHPPPRIYFMDVFIMTYMEHTLFNKQKKSAKNTLLSKIKVAI